MTGSLPRVGSPGAIWRALLARDPAAPAVDGVACRLDRRAFEALVVAEVERLRAEDVAARDIVAWLGWNGAGMLAALLACERLGAVLLPLNWRLSGAELLDVLRHAGVATLRATPECEDAARPLRQVLVSGERRRGSAQDGDLLLVYTSGTTGRPKGAMHTAAQVAANAHAAIAVQGFGPQTRVLGVLPMFHVGGLCIQVLPALLAGGVLRLHARFDPQAWIEDVAAWRPTTSLLVPATLRAVVSHPAWPGADLSSLDFVNAGSSVVPLALIEAFHRRGVPVCQVYGSTETGPFSIALRQQDALTRPGSVGTPAPGVAIRLVGPDGRDVAGGDVGEIRVRGDNVMRGYHRDPDNPSFDAGWFHSGDLARRSADGFFEVVGRSKDMIISGGENIYPAEIENLVAQLPQVAECVVVGLPDERWGEVPVLVVVAAPGAAPDEARIRSALEGRLARFKHPREVIVMPDLPRTALGKVRKDALVQRLLDVRQA